MAIGTAFTLFFVPSIYVLLAKDHAKEGVGDANGVSIVEPVAR